MHDIQNKFSCLEGLCKIIKLYRKHLPEYGSRAGIHSKLIKPLGQTDRRGRLNYIKQIAQIV